MAFARSGSRSRLPLLALGSALAAVVAAVACSSFSGEDAPNGTEADASPPIPTSTSTVDGSAPDATAPDGVAPLPGIGAIPPNCPRPPAPKCAPDECPRRVLYTPPATPRAYPFAIVTDGNYVYWVEQSNRDGHGPARILRVPKTGGVAPEVIADNQMETRALVLDGEYIYWSRAQGANSMLVRAPRGCRPCGSPDERAPLAAVGAFEHLVRLADGELFGLSPGRNLYRHDVKGSTLAPIIVGIAGPPSIAVTPEVIFAAGLYETRVYRVATGGGLQWTSAPAKRPSGTEGFGVLGSTCAFTVGTRGGADDAFYRINLDGGASELPVVDSADVYGVAADARYVYVAHANAGGVTFFDPTSGDAPKQIVEGDVWRLAVDGDGVYWGTHGVNASGEIMMLVTR